MRIGFEIFLPFSKINKDCNDNQIISDNPKEHFNTVHKCSYCDIATNFKTKKNLDEHIKLFHSLQCDFCKIGDMKTKISVERHMNEYHKIESKYHVEKKIGSGSFGEIHEGKDTRMISYL